MMRNSRSLVAGLTIAGAVALAGPAAAENVLRWASAGGATTFDPHSFDETRTSAQLAQVYEGLSGLDSSLELVPRLAVGWRLVDPTTWEFELRKDVPFHDGTPFTARDVVFSFTRAKTELSPPVGVAHYIESIAEVRAIGEHSVRVKTAYPDPQLPEEVRYIYIMSERWADDHGARVPANIKDDARNYASLHANGTGAFVLKAFEPGGPAVMVRNPHWWGLERYPHNLDRIEFTPIADPQERLAALLRGDLDLLTDPPFDLLDEIRSRPNLKLAQASQPRTAYLGLEQSHPQLRSSDVRGANPFRDRRVRQAVYQAIDIEAIREEVMQELAIPAGMLIVPVLNRTPELDQRLPYDPATAERLLAAAGYPEGFSVTLDCPVGSSAINAEAICRSVASQLAKLDVEVEVNARPKNVIYAKVDARQTDFYLDSYQAIEPQHVFTELYRTGGGLNASGYSNPRVDELINKIDREMITYGRDALIEEVWKIVLDDIVYIPLHYQVIVWAMRENLEVPVFPVGFPLFREARFKAPKVN